MDLETALDILDQKSSVFRKVFAIFPVSKSRITPTAAIGLKGIVYNEQFMDGLPDDVARAFVFGHECIHAVSDHLRRRQDRDPVLWNRAADEKTNDVLISEYGFPKPSFTDLHSNYDDSWSAERIYQQLVRNPPPRSAFDDHSQWGILSNSGQNELNEKIKRLVKSLDEREKGELKRLISKIDGPQHGDNLVLNEIESQDTALVLLRLVLDKSEREVTFRQPNRRLYGEYGIYLPSRQRERIKAAFIIDTSGSTQGELVHKFARTLQSFIRSNDVEGVVIHADNQVQKIEPIAKFKGKLHGGGGTDFGPGIEAAKKMGARIILYFTDLNGDFPDKPERVIWIAPKGSVTPPFGRKLELY